MKKALAYLLSVILLLPVSACGSNPGSIAEESAVSSVQTVSSADPVRLTNKMTETELARVSVHSLTLLDPPEENPETPEAENAVHQVSIEFHTDTPEGLRKNFETYRPNMTDEEYQECIAWLEEKIQNGGEFPTYPMHILVDGFIMPYLVPESDCFQNGVPFRFTRSEMTDDGTINRIEMSFDTFEEYEDWIRESDAENGYTDAETELDIERLKAAYNALLTGDYETLPEGSVDITDSSLYAFSDAGTDDYRDQWEYDRDAVAAIQDSVTEINIYDAELNNEFLVHVTLPPGYDPDSTYPVFFLTDGVWRFGNVPALRDVMEQGEAAPVILVSLGYNYHIDGTDGNQRYHDLVIQRDKLLDFVTDNLMPYLGEHYHIDYENSTLYGHSDGGVFAHDALFKSDLYENQPFGRYIIGSPALWGLYNYNDHFGIDSADCRNDYGYFDRNEKLNKSVFLCAGSQEDPDYADSYDGQDTTLEGVEKLKERLEQHGADLTCKLYESHHYQYIPEMLTEYLKKTYPAVPSAGK